MLTDRHLPSSSTRLIAPLWHTALLATCVMAVSLLGLGAKAHGALATRHIREYLLTLAWEWLLFAVVLWGLRLRRTPLRVLLGEWPSGGRAWLNDLGAAAVFWVGSSVILAAVSVLLRMAHATLPAKSIEGLAPANVGELLLFLLLSISAGFCEELLFRGYFQQQFDRIGAGRTGHSLRISIAVAASALLFGCAHLYEGLAGVIAITIFGAMFSLLAIERRSLRAGMIAHAWHDALSGCVLFALRHSHLLR